MEKLENKTNQIIQQYHDNGQLYRNLDHDINDILVRIVEKNHFRISNMAIRIKSEEALRKKIELKNKYQDILDVTDVVACRVILLFENDVDLFYERVKENFEVVEYTDKRKKNYDDRIDFGYNSLHLLVKFTDERCKMIEYSDYKDIIFEMQIRTVLQHSWAEIEHGLGYKSQYEIPRNIRRRLARLSATLELVDEEFVFIAKAVDEYNNGLVHMDKIYKTDINMNSLMKYMETSDYMKQLEDYILKNHHVKLIQDTNIMTQAKLIHRMHSLGYLYINELDEFIGQNIDSIKMLIDKSISINDETYNIYYSLVVISISMFMNQGIHDPENIFNDELVSNLI